MATRATPPLLKNLNERTVLDAIRSYAPVSRAEISRRVGISKPTVSLALQSLLDAGLVREASPGGDGPSYGAVFFEPVTGAAFVLGLDVGARFVRGALCDLAGVVRVRQDVELPEQTAAAALDVIASLAAALRDGAGVSDDLIDGLVVGVPGAVAGSRIALAENVSGLEGARFARNLNERLGRTATIENDINLAALGEQWRGIARGVDDFAFISIGTGLGAGLVLRGELHRGRNGAAGELDYARAGLEENIDPCAGALIELTRERAGGRETTLEEPYDTRVLFAAARASDDVAVEIVAEEARRIALHIAPIAAVADVGLVVLGGGIGANGDLLFDPIRRLLEEWLPSPPRVEASSLGDAAILTGALAVGRRAALDNVFVNRRSSTSRS
ncbi:MAG TPA: ROK family transcriptional regulator [Vicinamibacterales bacterium]|nr:ROK family transcriptional regulator [Vicinamibacterales bacterium]